MSAISPSAYEWKDLPWHQLEQTVFKLQKRIFRASSRGDVKTVHRLQKLLMKSWSARCLAVRRVSQDNQGRRTAGVDGVKSLSQKERLTLVNNLKIEPRATPTRRVWIPKSGSMEKRPLGIPTMVNRAQQACVKLALEPEWEAKFAPNSYGFRPGRSCHDAVEAIFTAINQLPKYCLDADICKCFDRINHQALLNKLETFPKLRRVLKTWLKAGVVDQGQLYPTTQGAPQGGVISPLLMNVALHGLETQIKSAFPASIRVRGKAINTWKPEVIRYADDLVVLHRDVSVIQQCQRIASDWLQGMGLELKPSKTRIGHTLKEVDGQIGFEFLGFDFRQYKVGKTHSRQGFKTIIKPAKAKVKLHYERLASIVETHQAAPQAALIRHLNPVIRGWCNYYATVVSKQTYSKLHNQLYGKLRAWAKRRHPEKSGHWVSHKYWALDAGQGWRFATKDGATLFNHAKTPIVRHTKVRGMKSPYDGDFIYWATRRGKDPMLSKGKAKLLKRQKGRCLGCGLFFNPGDLLEIDHVKPKAYGGKDLMSNQQVLHRHCHHQKTAADQQLAANGIYDRD
ncbi:MAG: group II intron reverse transcriptase/maturase [Phormidesmis sp.]